MYSIATLKQQIKFALGQLSSANAHHEFEHLCFDIAKHRVCSNILRATGPVSAGGDQGKDFETFKTYIETSPIANSTFIGLVSNSPLVFACTLNKRIKPKIKSDVSTIMGGKVRVDGVHYFSANDIPVSTRHDLQEWASATFNVTLEIYDATAITDFLSERELFWIAEQYLNIPGELYPRSPKDDKDWYEELLSKWRDNNTSPETFADFTEIKMGIRHATFHQEVRQDLSLWIKLFEQFLSSTSSDTLKRYITYEIAVASLRGKGSMLGQEDRLRAYFSIIPELTSSKDIEDTAILATYCTGAIANSAVEMSSEEVQLLKKSLSDRIDEILANTKNIGYKCSLLETQGGLCLDPLRFKTIDAAIETAFNKWDELLNLVDHAPLFPLERFSDRLTNLIAIIGSHPLYHSFTRKVDEHLSKRYGGFIAAEKCRDRALAFYDKGDLLNAIKELHQAKIDWFAEETLKGSLLAMLLLSQWYTAMGLAYAGKHYALAVAYISAFSVNENVKSFIPRGLAAAAESDYSAGAWWSYLDLSEIALKGHGHYSPNPDDIEKHHFFQNILFSTTIIMHITSQLDEALYKAIKERVDKWEMSDIIDPLLEEAKKSWSSLTKEKIWETLEEQLHGKPFNDLGQMRTVTWLASGITWSVSWENTYEKTAVTEQFISALQILSVDLTDVDLCLLKSDVVLEIDLHDSLPKAEPVDENKERRWNVHLPNQVAQEKLSIDDFNAYVLATAVQILSDASLLPEKEMDKALEAHFKDGLSSKVFIGNTYSKLFREFNAEEDFEQRTGKNFAEKDKQFTMTSHPALKWNDSPRAEYTKKESDEIVAERYKRGVVPIHLTLERLAEDKVFMTIVHKLRKEGWKDWHFITAISHIVLNERVNGILKGSLYSPEIMTDLFKELSIKEESKSDPVVPTSLFTENNMRMSIHISQPSTLQGHGLQLRQHTPNFNAIDHFLRLRYGYWDEDIEHEPIL